MIWSILALELVTKKENISSSLASNAIVTHSIPGFRMFSGHDAILLLFQEVQASELKVSPWPRRLQS